MGVVSLILFSFDNIFATIFRFKNSLLSFRLWMLIVDACLRVCACVCVYVIQTSKKNYQLQTGKQIALNLLVTPPVFMFAYNFSLFKQYHSLLVFPFCVSWMNSIATSLCNARFSKSFYLCTMYNPWNEAIRA